MNELDLAVLDLAVLEFDLMVKIDLIVSILVAINNQL